MKETMMNSPIRIAAIDDHPLFLAGLRRAISRSEEFTLVADGATASDAIIIAREFTPDILLLDIDIEGNGIDAARRISAEVPSVRIVMLTASGDDEDVAQALAAGVKGYVVKGSTTRDIVQALRSVRDGNIFITPAIATRVLSNKMQLRTTAATNDIDMAKLNDREKQVLDFAAQGLSNKEIAQKLDLTVHTVKNYMSRILSKLRVSNRAKAAAKVQSK